MVNSDPVNSNFLLIQTPEHGPSSAHISAPVILKLSPLCPGKTASNRSLQFNFDE